VLDIDEQKRAENNLRESEERLAADLEAMTQLHAASTRLLACRNLETALNEVLDAGIAISRADFGCMQVRDPESGTLELVAHRGFKADFCDHFRTVDVHDRSTPGGRILS